MDSVIILIRPIDFWVNPEVFLVMLSDASKLNPSVLELDICNCNHASLLTPYLTCQQIPVELGLSCQLLLIILRLSEGPCVLYGDQVLTLDPFRDLLFTLASGPFLWVALFKSDHEMPGFRRVILSLDLGLLH